MSDTDDPNDDDEFDPDADTTRGPLSFPSDDACRNGHVDWEVVAKGNTRTMRCRICGDERPYNGLLLNL